MALQTLRRLSDETGGVFIESDQEFDLPPSFLSAPYKNIDTEKAFSIDLETVDLARIRKPEISLIFQGDENEITLRVPVVIPPTAAEAINIDAPTAQQDSLTTGTLAHGQAPTNPAQSLPYGLDLWLWYGVPAALAILLIPTLIALVLLYRQAVNKTADERSKTEEFRPYAYLIT